MQKKISSTVHATIIAIVLVMGSTLANAQNSKPAAAPTATATTNPDVVTKSDLRQTERTIATKLKQAEVQRKAEADRTAQQLKDLAVQAEAQRKAAAERQEAQDEQDKADRKRQHEIEYGTAIIVVAFLILIVVRTRTRTVVGAPESSKPVAVTAKDLYDRRASAKEVEEYLLDPNNEAEGVFIIDLPNEGLVFEYKARVREEDEKVFGYFDGNGDVPTAMENQKLRKTAKRLYSQGLLKPMDQKTIGIGLVRAS